MTSPACDSKGVPPSPSAAPTELTSCALARGKKSGAAAESVSRVGQILGRLEKGFAAAGPRPRSKTIRGPSPPAVPYTSSTTSVTFATEAGDAMATRLRSCTTALWKASIRAQAVWLSGLVHRLMTGGGAEP